MRLSAGTLIVLIVAILVAIAGAYALKEYLQEETAPPDPPVIEYAIAITDLEKGRVLTLSDIGLVNEGQLIGLLDGREWYQPPGANGAATNDANSNGDNSDNANGQDAAQDNGDAQANGEEQGSGANYYVVRGAGANGDETAPPQLALPMDVISNPEVLIGKRLRYNVVQGTPFEAHMFYREGTRPHVSDNIATNRPGFTTFDIHVRDFMPEDQEVVGHPADVIFHSYPQELEGYEPVLAQTRRLVSFAQILEVGEPFAPSSTGSIDRPGASATEDIVLTPVTLAVTPEQVKMLNAAQQHGDFRLTVYPKPDPSDPNAFPVSTDIVDDEPVTLADLVDLQPIVEPAPEITIEPFQTMVWRGTEGFTTNSFDFADLLRELNEIGAISVNVEPEDNGQLQVKQYTSPQNQPAGGSGSGASLGLGPGSDSQGAGNGGGNRQLTPPVGGGG